MQINASHTNRIILSRLVSNSSVADPECLVPPLSQLLKKGKNYSKSKMLCHVTITSQISVLFRHHKSSGTAGLKSEKN